ncbi:glutamate ABC transporter substrate-binding protein [Streptomyces beijiangensis]|uniref:Glutamate ABC transporter substrate-binding protein n=1 Tax=Streptomyces beijiangensis TaxID=163361 RepID=A0A939JGG4_9ACTN|nr:glutamate ABC transporter substrate-binding protein [Streptomyces beijiangensis]MBO0510484.1 glutamate ABC transporter substrate-binding protein [Streptomyces beijiangensis]
MAKKPRLRGWGGVTGMAAACVLTAAVTLGPIAYSSGGEDGDGARIGGQGVGQGVTVQAADCTDPEASLTPSSGDGPTIDKIKQAGKLVVGVDQNSYRWGYRNPATRSLEGFDIDLVRAIAQNILGDPDAVIYRAIPTNQRIEAIQKDKVDIVVRTMTINCARIKQVAFSTAYFQAGQQVLAPKGSPITGYNDTLKGKKVCTATGSTAYDALKQKSFGAVFEDTASAKRTVPNQLDCLVRLQIGEVDAVVTDNALAAGQAAQDPAVELKGDPFTTEYYGVATKIGKDDLVRRINQVLVDYRADGKKSKWMQAYRTWLASDLKGISGPPVPKYR